jgi:hypothetical protein
MRADNIDGQDEEDVLMHAKGGRGQSFFTVSAIRVQSRKRPGSTIFESSF